MLVLSQFGYFIKKNINGLNFRVRQLLYYINNILDAFFSGALPGSLDSYNIYISQHH